MPVDEVAADVVFDAMSQTGLIGFAEQEEVDRKRESFLTSDGGFDADSFGASLVRSRINTAAALSGVRVVPPLIGLGIGVRYLDQVCAHADGSCCAGFSAKSCCCHRVPRLCACECPLSNLHPVLFLRCRCSSAASLLLLLYGCCSGADHRAVEWATGVRGAQPRVQRPCHPPRALSTRRAFCVAGREQRPRGDQPARGAGGRSGAGEGAAARAQLPGARHPGARRILRAANAPQKVGTA